MPGRRRLLRLLALVLAVVGLAACSVDVRLGDEDASDDHVAADVTFAEGMVPHHAQALMMVRMARGRPLDPDLRRLMSGMAAAQAPEIEEMSGWLDDWGEGSRGHMGGMGVGGMNGMNGMVGRLRAMGDPQDGMLSMRQMRALRTADDARFPRLWLRSMITHHEGAIAMARTERAEGRFPAALDLATRIEDSQTAEIRLMEQMLGR